MELLERFLDTLPLRGLGSQTPVVAVLRLDGVIGSRQRGFSLVEQAAPIERAFKLRNLTAVALAINSPGGSPVQSALIAKRIRALADENNVPVFAFAEDVAASGGYWLACAADEIYADDSSIIGSIGVVSGSFGFTELIKKIGVERRLHTAGDKKAILDPFTPEKATDVKHLKALQHDIHESFAETVRVRRGKRLLGSEKEIFSGAFWTGGRALELGLVDGIGDLRSVMRQRFGAEVKLRPVKGGRPFWKRRFGLSRGFAGAPPPAGDELAAGVLAAVEERLIWNRFGL